MFALSDKKALVTGASGGIGGAIAGALHAQGATLTLAGRTNEALERLAGELGDRCMWLPAIWAMVWPTPCYRRRRDGRNRHISQ